MARKNLTEAEWAIVRHKYVTTAISGRDLAQKENVSYSTLAKRAKREQWEAKRMQHGCNVEAKLNEQDIEKKADFATQITEVAGNLLSKIGCEIIDAPSITASDANKYASALDKLKGVLNIRTAEDLEEQRARIEKLRKEAAKEDRSSTITVTMEGDIGTYGK